MRLGVLKAVTDFAKTRSPPDIPISQGTGISIGRNNANGAGTVPGSWSQVSGIHCKVSGSESLGFTVTDSSTNGTWIISEDGEAVRVPKKQSRPLLPGEILRLSALADGADRQALPEYRLDLCDAPEEAAPEEAAQEVPSQKRQRVSSGADGVSVHKQIAALQDENQATNEAYRREQQLSGELRRSHKGEMQAALNEKDSALQQLADEKKGRSEALAKLQSSVDSHREAEKKLTEQHAAALAEQQEVLSSTSQEKQQLQVELEAAQQELTSAQASFESGTLRIDELMQTIHDRDAELQALQSRVDAEAAKTAQLQGEYAGLERKFVLVDREFEATTSSLDSARGVVQKLQMDIKFADANYKNLQRVAAPLAAMADDSQAAEQSLVDALMKAARECFARQSQQAAAAQQLREMLPSPDRDLGNEPSQTATYRVEAGDEVGNDQEPTQGMEASPARMQTAPTEAPPTVTSSSPPESAASHRADSLITLRAESDVTEADATARDDNEGEQPVCRDAVRSGSAAQQQGDTQQASAAHTSSVSKEVRAQVDANGAGDEEMTDEDGDASDRVAAAAAAAAAAATSSSGDSTGNDDDTSMEVDLRNEIDIETQAGENSASVPRTNASAPWRAEHGSMLEPIALTGGVA